MTFIVCVFKLCFHSADFSCLSQSRSDNSWHWW